MANRKRSESVDLDKVVRGQLPDHILDAVNNIELSIADLQQWEASKPKFYIAASDGYLTIDLNLRLPIKKLLAWVGSIGGFLLAVVKLVTEYWPQIQDFLIR